MKNVWKILIVLFTFIMFQNSVLAELPSENSYALYRQIGFEAYNKKDYAKAIQYLSNIPKSQHTLEMVICIANSYESIGDTRSAVLLLESLNRHNPNNYSAFYNLGNIYLKAKVYKNAIESYRTAIKLNTKFAPAYYNLGIAYYETRDFNKALFHFEKAIRLNPSNKDYIYNAAVCLEAMGDKKTADEYYKKAE